MRTSQLNLASFQGWLSAAFGHRGHQPPVTRWFPNTVQYAIGDAVGKLLTGDLRYAPAGMYIQYTNNPAWVSPTDYGRDAKAYFHSLADGESDLLRVPLLVTPTTTTSQAGRYASNLVEFLAMTAGIDGAPGLIQPAVTFQRGVSLVVGGAVIAMPEANDYTQDLILNRGYLPDAERLARPADPFEVLLRWRIQIG